VKRLGIGCLGFVGILLAAVAISAALTSGVNSDLGTAPTTTQPADTDNAWSDGVYEVGPEIKPGVYKTTGREAGDCYWARLADSDGQNILANQISSGRLTLRVRRSDKFIELNGGCVWKRA